MCDAGQNIPECLSSGDVGWAQVFHCFCGQAFKKTN